MSSQEQEPSLEERVGMVVEELEHRVENVEARDDVVTRAIHDLVLNLRAIDNRINVWEQRLNTHAGKLKELEDKIVMLQGLYSRLTMADPIEPRVAKTEQEILEAQDFHEYCEVTLDEHAGRIEGVERWLENVEGRLVGAGIK